MFAFSLVLFLLLFLSPEQGGESSRRASCQRVVTVHMEGEGFMCPFLTPQFMDLLQSRSHWVHPEPLESRIHYAQPLDEAWSQDEVIRVSSRTLGIRKKAPYSSNGTPWP